MPSLLRGLQGVKRERPELEVRTVTVAGLRSDNSLALDGGLVAPSPGTSNVEVGARLPAILERGRAVFVMSHQAKHVQFPTGQPRVVGPIVEELFVTVDPQRVYFRNADQVTELAVELAEGEAISEIQWGLGGDRFFIVVGSTIRVYTLNREPDVAYQEGEDAEAELETVVTFGPGLFSVPGTFVTPSGFPSESIDLVPDLDVYFAGPLEQDNVGLPTLSTAGTAPPSGDGFTLSASLTDTGPTGPGQYVVNAGSPTRILDWYVTAARRDGSTAVSNIVHQELVANDAPGDAIHYQVDLSWSRVDHAQYGIFVKDYAAGGDPEIIEYRFVAAIDAFEASGLALGPRTLLLDDRAHLVYSGDLLLSAPIYVGDPPIPDWSGANWIRTLVIDLTDGTVLWHPASAFSDLTSGAIPVALVVALDVTDARLTQYLQFGGIEGAALVDARRGFVLTGGAGGRFFVQANRTHVMWLSQGDVVYLQEIATGEAVEVGPLAAFGVDPFGGEGGAQGFYWRLRLLRPFSMLFAADDYPPGWFPVVAWEEAEPNEITLRAAAAEFPLLDEELEPIASLAELPEELVEVYPTRSNLLQSYQAVNDDAALGSVGRSETETA
jgi:hypothetical protein